MEISKKYTRNSLITVIVLGLLGSISLLYTIETNMNIVVNGYAVIGQSDGVEINYYVIVDSVENIELQETISNKIDNNSVINKNKITSKNKDSNGDKNNGNIYHLELFTPMEPYLNLKYSK